VLGAAPAFSAPKQEEAVEPQNGEWVFYVTAFDVSALPASHRIIGEVLQSSLVRHLNSVKHRIRLSPEYAFYEGSAWSKVRSEAGRRIAQKREERDNLLFRGYPEWQYQRSLKAINTELEKLEEEYRKADAEIPLIVERPGFVLSGENEGGLFPVPPPQGTEYRYCVTNNADAFLTGRISEFHGRLYIDIGVYARYARSYIYEDSILFSSDDLPAAVDEIGSRLAAALEGTPPASMIVRVQPPEAAITINGILAGRGDTGVLEYSPGETEITVSAENYETQTLKVDIALGELTEISFNLNPLSSSALDIDIYGSVSGGLFRPRIPLELSGNSIYRGALYQGEAPMAVDINRHGFEYITVEAPGDQAGGVVVFGGEVPSSAKLIINTYAVPHGEPLNRARRSFYNAYGALWIALPIAFVVTGVANSIIDAYNMGSNPVIEEQAVNAYYIAGAVWIVTGGIIADSLFGMVRYTYTSSKNEPKLGKFKQ
jgi:hypothetical protein